MATSTAPQYRLVRRQRPPAAAPVLDAAQRRVVEHAGGPLLVLAGPGTGKTTTLVEAAVARVAAGVPVERLLMLTFSRRAAGELRDRVTARLGGIVREPIARTLHSYAFGVLRMAAVRNGLPPPRLLSGPEQDVILRTLVAGSSPAQWPPELRPALATRAFAGELRDLIMRAVERGLDGPALAELGRSRDRPDWVAAGALLREYQDVTVLQDPGGYDPAELIRSAVNALRDDPELLAAERTARRRLFVDEYQDTDPAQLELLRLLADGADELILVGDPDQSIYAFRGADSAAVRDAGAHFGPGGEIETVALDTCRRSGATLLAASRRVAANLPGPARHRQLIAAPGLPPGEVEVARFRSAGEQAAYLAGVLRRAHLDGLAWPRMAVLVRSTANVLGTLRRALATAGVPVTVRGEDLPLAEQPVVAMLLDVLACARHPEQLDEEAAERLLQGPIGGADVVYLRRLRRAVRQVVGTTGGSDLLAPAVQDLPGAAVLPPGVRGPVERVATVLAAAREQLAAAGSPEDVLWAIWDASGLGPRWERTARSGGVAGAAADRDLDATVALFAAAARYTDRLPGATVDGFAEHLGAQQIPGDATAARAAEPDAVSILTAHAAKGLEWDLVCVAGVQEGNWPDLRRRGTLLGAEQLVDVLAGRDPATLSALAPQLAEERRLFYVAATRARSRLVVTAVGGDEEQPSRFLDELAPPAVDTPERPLTPPLLGVHLTGLVAELRAAVTDPAAADGDRAAAAAQLARLADAGVRGAHPHDWWGLLPLSDEGPVAVPGEPVPVSPSRIESFLDCEVRALLADLGVRAGRPLAASLGTVVHEIAATAPPDADLATLQRMLDERWSALDFGARWYGQHERERAGAILARLAAWLRDSRTGLELVAVEEGFGVEVGDAVLRGRVDRLERDPEGRLVVVDLKTGRSKPRPEELPTNAQLGAYQLAIERGAFGADARSGGAMLVQLATGANYAQQRQAPLAEADDPDWIAAQVAGVAAKLRGASFTATVTERLCRMCDVRASCPIQPEGRQVTQ